MCPSTGPCSASRRPISQGYLVHDTAAGVTGDGDPGDSLLFVSRIWRDVVTSIVSFTAGPLLFVFDKAIYQQEIRNFGLFQAKTSDYGL